MNLLVLLPLFLQEVFTQEAVVSKRQFKRLTHLDNIRPEGTPASTYPSRSKLECVSYCARDEACVAVVHHDGQCSIYGFPLSPSNVSLPGARGFHMQVHHEYLGCYGSVPLKYSVSNLKMTPDLCNLICYGRGYIYSETLDGHHCLCSDVFPDVKKMVPDAQCNKPCPGDGSKVCGGVIRSSFYKVV